MLNFPNIDPVALSIGPIHIYWYAIMYLSGYGLASIFLKMRIKKYNLPWKKDQLENLTLFIGIGCILGGRVGYVLFYNLPFYSSNPLQIFQIWHGGMSYHGGMIGVLLAIFIYGKKYNRSFFSISDFIAPAIPIGLALGRIGNFLGAQLYGKTTSLPWGMIFPNAGPLPRHPSQIYEFLLEGVLLFIILASLSRKNRPPMYISGMFMVFYSIFRFISEFFREPDPQIGYLAWHWLTMGQVLSIPMFIIGLVLIFKSYTFEKKDVINSKQKLSIP